MSKNVEQADRGLRTAALRYAEACDTHEYAVLNLSAKALKSAARRYRWAVAALVPSERLQALHGQKGDEVSEQNENEETDWPAPEPEDNVCPDGLPHVFEVTIAGSEQCVHCGEYSA